MKKSPVPLVLSYEKGSLLLSGLPPGAPWLPGWMVWDPRAGGHRCLAMQYRALVRLLVRRGEPYRDEAQGYPTLALVDDALPEPYPYQREALEAWSGGKRGIVELPTGAGKTHLALRAICAVQRGTLVLAPTLDLVAQWCGVLEKELGIVPGAVGGGSYDLAPVTVSTYASAYRKGELFGHRFCLAIFDECHHLGGRGYSRIGEVLIAPYRLGLSATPNRPEGAGRPLRELIGPVIYRRTIGELKGKYLAGYRTEILLAELTPGEQEAYRKARETYLGFARERGISLGSAGEWRRFVFAASRGAEGRAALDAYYRQRRIAFAPERKFTVLAELLRRHRHERVLIFTNDNHTAYEVARRYFLPIITHQTRIRERRMILESFRENRWPFLVTSRVLNEGVDVPAANIAVILSGSASVTEHVQRLGRILRKAPGKEAVLYEVLSPTPGERSVSNRRRQHDAYR